VKRLLSSCLLACTGVAAPVHAASEADWEALYGSALRQYAAGNYVQAEQEARRALALAREAGGRKEPFVASSLNALALAEQAQGRGEDAAGLLRQALALSEQALGAHPNTATLALNLGNALDALGRADAALVPYERALEIADARQDDGAMVPLRAQALSALARTHAGLGHANEARAYDRRLDTDTAVLPLAGQADVLERRARASVAAGNAAAARDAFEQALSLRGQSPGPVSDAWTRTAIELADLLDGQGLREPSAAWRRRIVEHLERDDPDSLALAAQLNELAMGDLARKAYGPARELLARALPIVEDRAGPRSLDTARVVANQALVLEAQGDSGQAQPLHARALEIYREQGAVPEALLGQAQALNYLAARVYRQRRFGQAEPMFLEALGLAERAVGPEDPRVLPLLLNLESLYRSQRRMAEVGRYGERAARLRASAEGGP